jgi:cytochrome P450
MSAEPPGPRGVPVIGNTGQYADDPFSFITACAEAYGDVSRFQLGPVDTYMLTNPADVERVLVSDERKYRKPKFQDDAIGDLLGEGLLMSEGEAWRKQRELAHPSFLMPRLSGLSETMVDYTEGMLDGWHDGEVIDVELEMARLTVEIIVDAMFGATIDEKQVHILQENLEPLGARFEPDPFRFAIPDWAPTRENRDYRAALSAIERIVRDLVEEREGTQYGTEGGEEPMDLLSVLLRARDRGEQTAEDIRDEMVTMLLAGHDTTALTLTYTWYLLSEHPDVEARVHAELDDLLGGGRPAFADVRAMEYTEAALQEAMRLYPPVYAMFREPQVDVRLGGYRVPAGSAVMLPQWAVHRSERYWDEPVKFDPDRWLDGRADAGHRFAYFPFGAGPRFCIGRQLSMLEARLIVGTVCQRYRLAYARDEPFSLRGSLTMHPEDGMEMRVVER